MSRLKFGLVLLAALVLLFPINQAQAASFSFNWTGTPATPQPWTPGAVNDWDLLTNTAGPNDLVGDVNGMDAVHGPNCEPPPATHHILNLVDSAFICNNHLMTALNGGYSADYMTPAQLLDWSGGSASLSWKISTQRMSSRDWWQVDLTPFDQNSALVEAPDSGAFYQGPTKDGLHIRLDGQTCSPSGAGGSRLRVFSVANYAGTEIGSYGPCLEDTVPPSPATRTPFQIDLTAGHVKLFMPGTSTVYADTNISLPFSKAVVQFSHHSYNPTKDNSGVPATWHWSDVSITNAVPFSMLRPTMPHSLHAGQVPILTLPQPAPVNSFLRFAAMGSIKVALNGGAAQPAVKQAIGVLYHPEHFSAYWMPIPAGTSSLDFSASTDEAGNTWWLEDAAVWSLTALPTPTPTSTPTPTPTPQTITDLPCTVTFPAPQGAQTGHCTGTFTQP